MFIENDCHNGFYHGKVEFYLEVSNESDRDLKSSMQDIIGVFVATSYVARGDDRQGAYFPTTRVDGMQEKCVFLSS